MTRWKIIKEGRFYKLELKRIALKANYLCTTNKKSTMGCTICKSSTLKDSLNKVKHRKYNFTFDWAQTIDKNKICRTRSSTVHTFFDWANISESLHVRLKDVWKAVLNRIMHLELIHMNIVTSVPYLLKWFHIVPSSQSIDRQNM